MINRKALTSLKLLLWLVAVVFALAAAVLISWSTSAATVTGRTPAASIDLVHGANTGILGPGEQRWFRYVPGQHNSADRLEKSLTLFFTPGNGRQVDQVSLQLFEEGQLSLFYQGDATKMANLGAGQAVARDDNPVTGELFWTGWLFGQQTYYIQLLNNSETVIDYWLFPENIVSLPPADIEPSPETNSVVNSDDAVEGDTPQTAIPLQASQHKGNLNAGQEIWYSFSVADQDSEHFEEAALTMIITPDNGNRIWYTPFEIFTARDVQNWWLSGTDLNNMGAGSVVYRDHEPLTGERIWSGWLIEDDLYYIRVRNGADVPIDYWLFRGDVYNPRLE
jgi:hypothetical protein